MASKRELTDDQMAQLLALEGREPETQDVPEARSGNWQDAKHGSVDMDVLDWLRRQGPGYQTTINRILRERMQAEIQKGHRASQRLP